MLDSGARSDTKSQLERILHFPKAVSSQQIHQEEQRVKEVFQKLSQISDKSFTVQSNYKVFLDQSFSILPEYK